MAEEHAHEKVLCVSKAALGRRSGGRRGGLESIGVDRSVDRVVSSLLVGGVSSGSRGLLVLIHLLILEVTVVVLIVLLLGGVLLGGLGEVDDLATGASVDDVVQGDRLALGGLLVVVFSCKRISVSL